MVDWDRVERLRARGWDWDRIAEDERSDFHAEPGAGDAGRALRAVYYQRRSRQGRKATGSGRSAREGGRVREDRSPWTLARIGYLLTPLFAIWFLLAFLFPSPVGVYVGAIPFLAIVLFVAAGVLAFGLFRTPERWSRVYRTSVAFGAILGLVIAGGFGLAAVSQGCPSLTPTTSSEPAGWLHARNAAWTENGAPVLYFYGAYACPYCSASSWSVLYALQQLGSVTGMKYGHSSSTDVYSNTPEVYVDSLSVQSPYVALVVAENHDPTNTVGPATSSCTQQAYVSAYSSGIPFIVVNGQYLHTGSLVANPGDLAGYNATTIQQEMSSGSGPAWNAISPGAFWILAYLVKLNGGLPTNVASLPQVQADLGQIS